MSATDKLIETLREDIAHDEALGLKTRLHAEVGLLLDTIARLEEENGRLKAALEPFEELADEGNEDQPDDTKVVVHAGRSIIYTLRLLDLRRARDTYRALV
jgi:hypothetical protein